MGKPYRCGICTYCGTPGHVTDDHVPPKNLFSAPRPSNLITVPACSSCNSKRFSKDDEYFRLAFALNEKSKGNPDREGVVGAVERSLARDQAKGLLAALHKARSARTRRLQSGLLRIGHVIAFDAARLERTAGRITEGLFFHHKGLRIPSDYAVNAMSLSRMAELQKTSPDIAKLMIQYQMDLLLNFDSYKVGHAFTYLWRTSPNGWARTHWMFKIYNQFEFFCTTYPKNECLEKSPASCLDYSSLASLSIKSIGSTDESGHCILPKKEEFAGDE